MNECTFAVNEFQDMSSTVIIIIIIITIIIGLEWVHPDSRGQMGSYLIEKY